MTGRVKLGAAGAEGLKQALTGRARTRRDTLAQKQQSQNIVRRNGDPVVELQVEMIQLQALKSAARRVKKSDPAQVARVTASILSFGLVVPVLVDGEGAIIHGHVVVEAARSLDLAAIPCIRIEHLSPEQARLLSISLNRLAETGQWDIEGLTLELKDLVILDEPLTITGFDEPVLDALLMDDSQDLATDSDELPPLGVEPVSRMGDHWQLGQHILACGDARDETLLPSLVAPGTARLGLIDPPYNVPVAGHVSSKGHREFEMASGEMTEAQFTAFLSDSFAPLNQALVAGGLMLSFMDWRGLYPMTTAARGLGFEELNLIVWAKSNGGMGSLWRSQHELIGAYKKPGAAHINNVELGKSGRWRSNLWRYPGASSLGSQAREELKGHPTPKPVALLVDAILDVSHRGDVVIDTFSGSGSTLIACERSGRKFCGVELDPLYVDLAVRRWEAETGERAVLRGSGRSFSEVSEDRRAEKPNEPPGHPASAKPRIRVAARSSAGGH